MEVRAGDFKVMRTPEGWKDLSGDLKLLQWEVAAYQMAETMRPVFHMPRSELLDRYNFLVLPGTSCHHVPRAHTDTAKARYRTYERLRGLANGESATESDVKRLQILE